MNNTVFFVTTGAAEGAAQPLPNTVISVSAASTGPRFARSGNPAAACFGDMGGLVRRCQQGCCCMRGVFRGGQDLLSPKGTWRPEVWNNRPYRQGFAASKCGDFSIFPRTVWPWGRECLRTDPECKNPQPPGTLGDLEIDGAAGCYMVVDRKQDNALRWWLGEYSHGTTSASHARSSIWLLELW